MLNTYQLFKINIFTLFDLSTLAAGQLNSQKVEFAKSIVLNLIEISNQIENEKWFKETPFGRRQTKQGEENKKVQTEAEFEAQVLEILKDVTIANQIDSSVLQKRLVVSDDIQNQVNSGDGCYLTVFNDNPTKEVDIGSPKLK